MRLFRTLIISIGIHVLLAIGASLLPQAPVTPPHSPTIVELLESPEPATEPSQEKKDDSEKQFVRSAPVPPELLTNEKKEKRFASEEEQNVIEERRARASGLTTNRSPEGSAQSNQTAQQRPANPKAKGRGNDQLNFNPSSPLERAQEELAEKLPTDDSGDVRVGGLTKNREARSEGSRPLNLPTYNGAVPGASTVGEALPDDIKFGDFTALNTDRHLFYTFYARMEEKIRHRWVTYARAALYNYQNGAKSLSGRETWTTKLEVILDKNGNFVRAVLQDSSGILSLDQAPVQAFRDAQQFPNPPKEMVKKDGSIHIEYAFSVSIAQRVAAGANE